MNEWIAVSTRAVYEAQKAGHLDPRSIPRAYFSNSCRGMGATWHPLLDDRPLFRARTIGSRKLRTWRPSAVPQLLKRLHEPRCHRKRSDENG